MFYAYNGESYSPNVGSLYLRARYYNIAAGSFFTEDSYLGDIREPLTLNRYVYCEGNPVNYKDPSGKSVENDIMKAVMSDNSISAGEKGNAIDIRIRYYHALQTINYAAATFDNVMSHDFDADIFYGGVEGVFHETLEALEARAEQMRANNTCYAIVGTDLIKPGTGTISEKGTELLKSYESLGEDYKIYEGGKLIAILSRDVEGEGNITYGYGILFRNTKEDRDRLQREYGLEFGEEIEVPIDTCITMYQDYINGNLDAFYKFLESENLWINQNQFDALIIHRHLTYRLGEETQNVLIEMFNNMSANDSNLKDMYWEHLYNAMITDLKNMTSQEKYATYGNGWENRIMDELELFFDGDANRDH